VPYLLLSPPLSRSLPKEKEKRKEETDDDQLARNGSLNLINAIYVAGDKYVPAD
jgi:hypothetical protein